jgi:glycosyltransferase involved in cell wall biosynthesis
MKILHIINTLDIGGAQTVLAQLLEDWDDSGDQQMLISLRNRAQLSGRIEALNIPVEHINLLPGKIEPAKFLKLIQSIRACQPDVVQTWLYHADLIGSVAVRLVSRAPIVWGVHHTMANRHSVKSSTWNVVKLLSLLSNYLPAHIVCCSQSAYQTHLDLGYPSQKMTIVPNGIDTQLFRPDPYAHAQLCDELGLPAQAKLIGMFARFHPQKDHDTLISAAAIIINRNPDVHFVLAGEGVDKSNKQLHDKISCAGIQNNVHLLGSRQDMPRLNAGMHIVTLSSSYGEALPMTLCEAMSCAVPCVATDIGDTAALLGNTGSIVNPQNPQALADAWQNILELSDMEYNHLSNLARQRVLEFYNLTNMLSKYKNIYHELRTSR